MNLERERRNWIYSVNKISVHSWEGMSEINRKNAYAREKQGKEQLIRADRVSISNKGGTKCFGISLLIN